MAARHETGLDAFFKKYSRAALGFSGGADSAYLLYAGVSRGADISPYYVKSAFQPEFELADARRLCRELNRELTVIELDILGCEAVTANPPDRCYHCKRRIFSALSARAAADGCSVLIDGSNASDDAGDRPGMRALGELGVLSPLRDCGITKPQLRQLSREAGLFTWDKPAYACLATRIPTGELITADKLVRVESAENELFSMGFTDFRVRLSGSGAKLQFPAAQLQAARDDFGEIERRIGPYFSSVFIDSNCR